MFGRSIRSWRCERAKVELLEKEDPFNVAAEVEVWVAEVEEGAYDEVPWVEIGYDDGASLDGTAGCAVVVVAEEEEAEAGSK